MEGLMKDAMMATVMASRVSSNLGEMGVEASRAFGVVILGEMVEA